MKIERILVPIDFSAPSLEALEEAAEFSQPYGAKLMVMYAVERRFHESPLLAPDESGLLEAHAKAAEEKLEEICRGFGTRGSPVGPCSSLVSHFRPSSTRPRRPKPA
jgi:nucleotide-binding universal stress UspA family protein